MHFKSIKKKIVIIIALILFIKGIIITAAVSYANYQAMEGQKKLHLNELTTEKGRKISIYLKSHTEYAEYLSTIPDIIKWTEDPSEANRQEASKFFSSINIKEVYSVLYILNSEGNSIITTETNFLGNNYSFRPYFKEAISGKPSMYVATGVDTRLQGYYFSQPIRNKQEEIIGVLVLKLTPDNFYKVLNEETKHLDSHIMLTDENGIILYSDLKDRGFHSLGKMDSEIAKKIKEERKFFNIEIPPLEYQQAQEIVTNQKGGEITNYNFFDENNKSNKIITILPIKDYSLFLVTEDDSWILSGDSIGLGIKSGSIILLSEIIILIIIYLLISQKLKPLKKLEKMARNISNGELDIENRISSGDEIEELGNAFVKTAQKLKNYYSDLEKNVLERTKELNEKNAYLNNTKVATLNILEDIQEEKNKTTLLAKDLEKFKLALDNASDHVAITDSEGIVLYGNKGLERITGYKLSEVIGKKAGLLWKIPMPHEYYERLWKTIKIEKRIFDGEIKNKRKNGEIYDAKITISPVLNDQKEIEFFVAIERDITHEKMVDQAKTEFVSLASHQLRTPLSSVNWYAEMLLAGDGGKLNDEQTTFVKEIYTGNQRMVDLVNSLLNVSRLELGTFAVEPEPTDVVAMVKDVFKEMQPSVLEKKIKTNFEYSQDIPIIQADPKLFRIVFQNLLSNAIKYTPDSGQVTLKLGRDKKNLLVEVSDTGYGIPKGDQSRIFQKLFRAENVRERDTEGTGLGLYIIKSIIDHAGGKINFKSEENKGTTFYLEIPLSGMKKKEGDKKIE